MNIETPLVSVVCPTYNHEKYIRQALEGFAMQQCNFPVEVIVHDDASTDNTAVVIQEYAAGHPFIRAILQTENQRSKGIRIIGNLIRREAKGKYIALCDGDDYWTDPLKLQKQVDFLEANPDYGLVYTKAKYYNQKQNKFTGYIGSYCDSFENLLLRNVVPTLTVVLRRNLYLEYFNEIKPHKQKWSFGDLPAWLWFANNSKIRYQNYVTSVYRALPESLSHSDDSEKLERFSRSHMSIIEYFIERYGGEKGNTLQDASLLKAWLLFKFACLSNRGKLFDKIRMNIDRIQVRSWRLSYMKSVLFCRPMRHLLIFYIKMQRIISGS